MPQRVYMAIDLKSFYASVECVERGLDPLQTNLVVADPSRTEKTICLAVSPALKAYGIPGRARLFEVIQKVGQVNAMRRLQRPQTAPLPATAATRGSWPATRIGRWTTSSRRPRWPTTCSTAHVSIRRLPKVRRAGGHPQSTPSTRCFMDATAYSEHYTA